MTALKTICVGDHDRGGTVTIFLPSFPPVGNLLKVYEIVSRTLVRSAVLGSLNYHQAGCLSRRRECLGC